MKLFLLILLNFMFLSSQAYSYDEIIYVNFDNVLINSDDVIAIAHRGEVKLAPENTIAAFEFAWKLGAHSIEIDVRTTKDGHLVIMHDSAVDRTTDGTGAVKELTLDEIKKMAIQQRPWMKHPPQKVPTLKEALLFLKDKTLVDLDIKDATPENTIEVIENSNMLESAYIDVGSVKEAEKWKNINPYIAIQAGDIKNIEMVKDYIDAIGHVEIYELEGLRKDSIVSKKLIDYCHDMGGEVHIPEKDTGFFLGWPIIIKLGVDGIQTDNLQMLIPYLNRLNN